MNKQSDKEELPLPDLRQLKKLVANNEFQKVIDGLLAITDRIHDTDLHDDVLIISSQFEQYQREQRIGSTDFDRLFMTRTRIGRSLLEIISLLPSDLTSLIASGNKINSKTRGIPEEKVKSRLFWLFLVAKVLLFLFIVLQSQTGGFSPNETFSTITLMLPVAAGYLFLMLRQNIKRKNVLDNQKRINKWVNTGFQNRIYIALIVYFIAIIWVITLKPKGLTEFENMIGYIALIESVFGIYLGEVVFELFQKK